MTAITAARGESTQQGIQPFDARRHLRMVAELIADVFAGELDAEGRRAVEEKESIGRWGSLLGGLLGSALFAEFISGFVWLEQGQVVGNITLQRGEESGTRWRISNVAVAEKYRGRGLGLVLMRAGLREIARRGGSWAVLQVRVDNPPARSLYDKLGFMSVCTDGMWHAAVLPRAGSVPGGHYGSAPQLLPDRAWRARFELSQRSRAPLAHWAEPIDPAAFRPGAARGFRRMLGEISGLQRIRRWGVWDETERDVLWGEVEAVANGFGDNHRLRLAVRESAPPGTLEALLSQGLQGLGELAAGAPARSVIAEYSGEWGAPGRLLELVGFRPRRVLLTMRRLITPADEGTSVPGLD